MGIRDVIFGESSSPEPRPGEMRLDERVDQVLNQNELLQENLTILEMSMEDEGWRRLSANVEREFTRRGIESLLRLSRAMYLSNPIIKRAVNVRTYYTWGQGVTIKAKEEKFQEEVVAPQMDEDTNRAELYSHQARLLTHVDQIVEGNIFMVLFTDEDGKVLVRSVPTETIKEIHTRKGDIRRPTFYRRVWTEAYFNETNGNVEQKSREALYPDWRYKPKTEPSTIGGVEVKWHSPIMHQRTGGTKSMLFGIPETYAALDWARAYKKYLEDWHTIVSSLAKFAWKMTTKGSKIKNAKEKLRSTIPDNDDWREENNRSAGGVFLGKEGDEITPIPKTGATPGAEDARASRMMAGTSMDLPDTIVSGDVDVGNFATSKTLDRPTWLKMRSEQFLWSDFEKDMWRYSLDAQIFAGNSTYGKVEWVDGLAVCIPAIDPEVKVAFPPILEEDPIDNVKALVAAATLEGRPEAGTIPPELLSQLLLEAVGVEDIEEAMGKLSDTEHEELEETVETFTKLVKEMRNA